MEKNTWIKDYVEETIKELNEQYPGIIAIDSMNQFIKTLQISTMDKEQIIDIINTRKEEAIKNYQHASNNQNKILEEPHYDLNELFDCRIANNTLHIHVVPKTVKDAITEMGLRNYLNYSEEKLVDAFGKIGNIIIQPENANIETIFAVSPLLKSRRLQAMFQKYSFDTSMTDNPYFIEMFKTPNIGQASISRNNFLNMLEEKNINTSNSLSTKK